MGRVSAPVAVVAPNAVKTALKIDPKIKKVAVFFAQNDAFSKSETETFQETLKSLNLDIVTVQKFQTTDTDFQNQATAAINIKPDLEKLKVFRIPGDCFIKLEVGTWHAGPLFDQPAINFYNLELSDTNIIDHFTYNFAQEQSIEFEIVD